MEFEKRKAATLASISSTDLDKSPKGTLDEPILPLIKTLNLHPSYFTTSSCSGRISILSQPLTTTTTTKKKARGGSWLFITHDPADPLTVTNLLFPISSTTPPSLESELVFRFEPFILAVECKDIPAAQTLVSTAICCGFRESGITSVSKRVIVAIRCSIRLEVPLGLVGRIMVSEEYVRYLVGIANEKMRLNRKRTDCFLQILESKMVLPIQVSASMGVEEEAEFCSKRCAAGNLTEVEVGNFGEEKKNSDTHLGLLGAPQCNVSVVKMMIVGEPVDKLFLWGHSSCTLNNNHHQKIIIFGGFGGLGRHARRNDSLMLDPLSGTLEAINAEGPPSPRLGHTSSMVEECLFIIGGRCDPTKILSDIWVLDTNKNKWRLLECTGSVFHPRHRHAAAVVDRKIYVFGGVKDETICSSMHVLDTENLRWSEINIQGEWPCPRHSHALVANGNQLFMFGGYDGEKALGDLYSFDSIACMWKKEKTTGRPPFARFSHSMFLYKHYLGVVGGCPVQQHHEELALLDLQFGLWKHVNLNCVGKALFVRSTANVVGENLVMIGGGASCYAFGTMFSEPMKMSLLPSLSFSDIGIPTNTNKKHRTQQLQEVMRSDSVSPISQAHTLTQMSHLNYKNELPARSPELQMGARYWVLQLERKYAKLGKDVLKKFGWLDIGRKVYSRENRTHICLPVTTEFNALFHEKEHPFESTDGLYPPAPATVENLLMNDVCCSTALNHLLSWGGLLHVDEVACIRKAHKSPQKIMTEAVSSLIAKGGLPSHLLEEIPARWERLGDIVVLPVACFKDPAWESIGEELWQTVAKSLGACRLARQGRIAATGTRDSTLEILVGDHGWVQHRENGIIYSFDATKCMFSWGNLSEKLRMAHLECKDELIVDLFAGIGYFTLPFLVRAKAKLVYACEWNPNALEALRQNIEANFVADRCVIIEGDNRLTAPKGVADRVCLGLLPTSEDSWPAAVRALRNEGGILHVHGIAKDSEEGSWSEHVAKSIHDIATSEGLCWDVSVHHLERVKWFYGHVGVIGELVRVNPAAWHLDLQGGYRVHISPTKQRDRASAFASHISRLIKLVMCIWTGL